MKERPIIFSAPMVKAILAGTKTQTRRVLQRKAPLPHHGFTPCYGTSPDGVAFGTLGLWTESGPDYPDGPKDEFWCPYGAPGDRLWVRETLAVDETGWIYRADGAPLIVDPDDDERNQKALAWAAEKPGPICTSIHMPRWASRITLEITNIRLEPLRDISREDAIAEGVPVGESMPATINGEPGSVCFFDPLAAFAHGWNQINGKRAPWNENPWVWAITFKRTEVP